MEHEWFYYVITEELRLGMEETAWQVYKDISSLDLQSSKLCLANWQNASSLQINGFLQVTQQKIQFQHLYVFSANLAYWLALTPCTSIVQV